MILYGLFSSWFSIDLKKASDSAWCASRPRVGSGTPGQKTAVSAECRLRKTSQSWAFHASSSVFMRCRLSSPLMTVPPGVGPYHVVLGVATPYPICIMAATAQQGTRANVRCSGLPPRRRAVDHRAVHALQG